MTLFQKIEIGVIVTIVLAIIRIAFWFGGLDNRVKALEIDPSYKLAKQKAIEELTQEISAKSINAIPIGTIISSYLDFTQFKKTTSDYPNDKWDPAHNKWSPADGRRVTGSKLADSTKETTESDRVPDLRGMFLRGLNYSEKDMLRNDGKEDPDGRHRIIGSYESDLIKKHEHRLTVYRDPRGGYRASVSGAGYDNSKQFQGDPNATYEVGTDTGENTGSETRPRNVAVYYYIRIN